MSARILLKPEAMARLMAYVGSCEGEVSGLGRVTQLPSGDFLVEEIALLRQESDLGGTRIREDGLAEFLAARLDRGEDIGEWRLWWHSHGSYDAFWSSTDEEMCAAFNGEWMIAIVANRAGDLLGRVDVYKPVHVAAELPVSVRAVLSDAEIAAVEAEIRDKVEMPPRADYSTEWWSGDEDEGDEDNEVQDAREGRSTRRDGWYRARGKQGSSRKRRFSSRSI